MVSSGSGGKQLKERKGKKEGMLALRALAHPDWNPGNFAPPRSSAIKAPIDIVYFTCDIGKLGGFMFVEHYCFEPPRPKISTR